MEELNWLDKAALGLMKMAWLLLAILASAVLPLLRGRVDFDTELKIESMIQSGFILQDAEHILPPDHLEMVLKRGRLMLAIIVCFTLYSIIDKVVNG